MKIPRKVNPFSFKDKTHKEFLELINKEIPIDLRYNEDLVNRVHEKYPLISKAEVAVIIKGVFESIRDLLILGDVINFHNFVYNLRIHCSMKKNFSKSIKIKLTTSPKLRANSDEQV